MQSCAVKPFSKVNKLFPRAKVPLSGQVSRFIKEKLCGCEIRNPSGVCCLGEVNKAVGRLMIQSVAMKMPANKAV